MTIAARLAALERERRERTQREAWREGRASLVDPLHPDVAILTAEEAFMAALDASGTLPAAIQAAERAYAEHTDGHGSLQAAAARRLPGRGGDVRRYSDHELARFVLAGGDE